MELEKKVIGYAGLAELLGYSKNYIVVLNSKHPERLPPSIRASKTKWHIDVVEEWLKNPSPSLKRRGGRPRHFTPVF